MFSSLLNILVFYYDKGSSFKHTNKLFEWGVFIQTLGKFFAIFTNK